MKLGRVHEEIRKYQRTAWKTHPNVYALLIERGVSSDIADEAQQLVVGAWIDASGVPIPKSLSTSIESAMDTADEIKRKIEDFMLELERVIETAE